MIGWRIVLGVWGSDSHRSVCVGRIMSGRGTACSVRQLLIIVGLIVLLQQQLQRILVLTVV